MWRPSDCPIKNSSFLHEPCHWRKRVSTRNPSILHRQTPTLHVPSNHRDFFGSNLTTSFTESHHRVLRVWPRLGRGCFLSRWLDIFLRLRGQVSREATAKARCLLKTSSVTEFTEATRMSATRPSEADLPSRYLLPIHRLMPVIGFSDI